ncbi:polysaccharide pyruvyl transferase family protein [Bacteroides fragilis]|nr:polysaccharide pyruvyl transferase family protein [Bacteroides fragilis]
MKKIGIITLPLDANYGGILQAYALMSFLKENGYDVTLYNKIHVREISPFVWSLIYMKRFFMKYIWRQKNLSVFAEKDIKKDKFSYSISYKIICR